MAKIILEELTNYGAWQMEQYGNVVPAIESTPEGELINSGLDELSRLAEWVFRNLQHNHICMDGPVIDSPGYEMFLKGPLTKRIALVRRVEKSTAPF